MRVLIAGGGHVAWQLALHLQGGGAEVTVATHRDPEQTAAGPVLSTQALFAPALAAVAEAGGDLWAQRVPPIRGMHFSTLAEGRPVIEWTGTLATPAASVDQRTAFPAWASLVEQAGGRIVVTDLDVLALDRLARIGHYDLVVVAAAGSPVADLFPLRGRDVPARALAVFYLDGVTAAAAAGYGQLTMLPGLGEVIEIPALTGPAGQERACTIVMIEACPGGPLHAFTDVFTPGARWSRAREVLGRHVPALADRCARARLTDGGATLVGAIAPLRRDPVAQLPSGQPVLAGGDVVSRMDPLGAQGANAAAGCARDYARALLRHDGPFDVDWLGTTGERWLISRAAHAATFTRELLAPSRFFRGVLGQAQQDPAVADRVVNLFAAPHELDRLHWAECAGDGARNVVIFS